MFKANIDINMEEKSVPSAIEVHLKPPLEMVSMQICKEAEGAAAQMTQMGEGTLFLKVTEDLTVAALSASVDKEIVMNHVETSTLGPYCIFPQYICTLFPFWFL